MQLISVFNRAREKGEKVFTAEITPPKSYDGIGKISEIVDILKGMDLKGLAVTNNTGGSFKLNPLVVVEPIRSKLRTIPIIVHLAARDEGSIRNLYDHIDEMCRKNVSNVLVLRGDPTPGNSKQVDSYKYSTIELTKLIGDYRGERNYPIDIFAAGHPEYPPQALAKHIAYQKKKIENGAQGIIANVITEPDLYARYVDALLSAHLDIPVIPSVIPLTSFRRAEFLENEIHVPVPGFIKEKLANASKEEAVKIGIDFSTQVAEALLKQGAVGVNFNVIFKTDAEYVKEILKNIRGYATIWEKYNIEVSETEYYESLTDFI